MRRFLFGMVFLFIAGCSRHKADPQEIADIFARHSCAEADPAVVMKAAGSGKAGLLRTIDPYAAILAGNRRPENDYPISQNAVSGLTLWKTAAGLEVVAVSSGSSAAAAGLAEGDTIKKLDGKDASGLVPEAVVKKISGRRGSAFAFEGEKKAGGQISGSVTLALGAMPAAWGFMVPGEKTAYLRLASFSEKTPEMARKTLDALVASGARAAVIDLRHSYGGSMESLSGTLALFAAGPKPLFKAVSRHPGYSREFAAKKAGPFAGLKLALLTDSATVSRAEIFAASLKEAGRAFTAGGTTAGNVAITKTFRLKKGGSLRLTVAKLATPAGADLSDKGVAPDVPVEDPLDGEYALTADFPPALASADPVIQAALKKLK